jgi:glycosyltransferase involved in cell wall biosynthesis
MRITWLSNAPWASTGYGNQTRVIVPRLRDLGHDMAIIAFYGLEGGIINWDGIKIFPRSYHPYGQDIARAHSQAFGADIHISLIDVWVCQPEFIKPVRWIPWFPVDSEPVAPVIVGTAARAWKRLVFAKHACKMMDEAGLDYDYIPLCVETKSFYQTDRNEARQFLRSNGINISDDAYMVGIVAANKGNPSRKAFDNQIAGFAQFAKKRKDAVLYIHSCKSEHGENQGVNLVELCLYYGLEIGKNVFFPDQYRYILGFPDDYMRAAYSAMDVKLMATMGEGFGIPIVEAQACGTPVIVGDWTANTELCFSGWKIPKAETVPMWNGLGTNQYHVRPEAVCDTLQMAYNRRGNQHMRERARAGALAYDADTVVKEFWQPYLQRISDEIAQTPALPELANLKAEQ